MLTVGQSVPEFSAVGEDDKIVTPATLRGTWTVIYFYPKDDTPGCTTEACSIRDAVSDFTKRGVTVYGVSRDSARSHSKFREKYGLNFPLLSDPDHAMIEAFGAWVEKSMYGKKYMGIERSTFIIDPKGVVTAVFPKVNPTDHATQLLSKLDRLMS